MARLAVVTSAAVADTPSQGSVLDHVVEPLLTRALGRALYDDVRRTEQVVRASDLDRTPVRPRGPGDADAVADHRVSGQAMVGEQTTRQDLADLLLSLATGVPSRWSGVHDGFHQQVAHPISPGAEQDVLATIWHDGLGR